MLYRTRGYRRLEYCNPFRRSGVPRRSRNFTEDFINDGDVGSASLAHGGRNADEEDVRETFIRFACLHEFANRSGAKPTIELGQAAFGALSDLVEGVDNLAALSKYSGQTSADIALPYYANRQPYPR